MSSFPHLDLARYPRRVRWFMAAAWAVIALKCVVVWWAMERYAVPFHPLWIIGPTLVFAALASVLWLAHREA